jgi:DNA polymerase III subunit epsilon
MSPKPEILPPGNFAAIDFETANYQRDSACSLAIIRVENDALVKRSYFLIRPPRREFVFTYIHGIEWKDVQDQPCFAELWPQLEECLRGLDFIVAHNAPFDKGVLAACCRNAQLPAPKYPFHCTVKLARQTWGLTRANLPTVCQHLGIPLNHHNALSDAEACARIALAIRAHHRQQLNAMETCGKCAFQN